MMLNCTVVLIAEASMNVSWWNAWLMQASCQF